MLKVTLPNTEIEISFRYPRVARQDRVTGATVYLRGTCCDVYTRNGNFSKLVVTGRTTCDPRDNFSRKEGRKKALAQALKCSFLTREERRLIWDAYNSQWGYKQIRGKRLEKSKTAEESSDRTQVGTLQESSAS